MRNFLKQFIFILIALAIIGSGALIIYSATPQGKINVKPSKTEKLKVVNQQTATSSINSINNPVAWWKFDEGTASSTYDSSGNGNTGTLYGGVQWTTGKLGKALSFDGVNDYVNVPNFAGTFNALTVEAWVYPRQYGPYSNKIVDFGVESAGRRFTLQLFSSGIDIVLNDISSGAAIWYSTPTNQWLHLVGVWSGTSFIRLYVNGVLKAENTPAPTISSLSILAGDAHIIGRRITAENYFNGLIDDVRIYNRALSATEVAQLYNSTKDGYLGKVKASTGLVGYWKLDDNTSTATVIDYSGKNNNGVFYDNGFFGNNGYPTSTSLHSTTTAVVARAMVFDGVNDYVNAGSKASLHITSEITVGAWVKSTQNNASLPQGIVAKANISGSSYGYILSKRTDNKFYFQVRLGSSYPMNDTSTYSNIAYTDNQWHHLVGVLLSNGTHYLYVDGVQQTAHSGTGTFGPTASNIPLLIGTTFGDSPFYPTYTVRFEGLIDDVRIYNRALSAEEIKQLYERGRNGLP